MVKIINKETLAEDRAKNGFSTLNVVCRGSAGENLSANSPDVIVEQEIKMTNAQYSGSMGERRLMREIGELSHIAKKDPNKRIVPQNAAQEPATTVLEELLGKIFTDITRRAQEAGDLTGVIAREETNLAFDRTINLVDILPYRGKFEEIAGTNQSVPLIEQAFGTDRSVNQVIRALGWKTALGNVLFNRMHELSKVTQAVADAWTDMRNSRTIGKIVAATFVASQKQAADATANATFDYKMYNTLRKGIKVLRGLKDPLTGRPIAIPSIAVLCNTTNTWDIERVIRGQLISGGGNGLISTANLGALPIAQIIEYDQGITNGFTWGKETLSFSGVTAGKCYLFVPRTYNWILNKRGLSLETGAGNVLQLSQEERAWYGVQAEYDSLFFGSSESGTALGAGYGAIVEVTLPSDT